MLQPRRNPTSQVRSRRGIPCTSAVHQLSSCVRERGVSLIGSQEASERPSFHPPSYYGWCGEAEDLMSCPAQTPETPLRWSIDHRVGHNIDSQYCSFYLTVRRNVLAAPDLALFEPGPCRRLAVLEALAALAFVTGQHLPATYAPRMPCVLRHWVPASPGMPKIFKHGYSEGRNSGGVDVPMGLLNNLGDSYGISVVNAATWWKNASSVGAIPDYSLTSSIPALHLS